MSYAVLFNLILPSLFSADNKPFLKQSTFQSDGSSRTRRVVTTRLVLLTKHKTRLVLPGFVGGFGWFWVVLGGFGWFRVLVTTITQALIVLITQALIVLKSVEMDDFWTLDMSVSTLDMLLSTITQIHLHAITLIYPEILYILIPHLSIS